MFSNAPFSVAPFSSPNYGDSLWLPITGVSTTAEVGMVTVRIGTNVVTFGVQTLAQLGTVSVSIPEIFSVSGVQTTGFVGRVVVWATVPDQQSSPWTPVDDSQTTTWTVVNTSMVA